MKKSILTAIYLSLCVQITNHVHADSANPPSEAYTNQVAAQVKVTHDSLQQVLSKMRNTQTVSTPFSHPDFVWAAKQFNEKVELAMIEFENTLKDILSKIDFYMKRLDAIQKSPEYTDGQKYEMKKNQIEVVKIEFEKFSRLYQKSLVKLYTTGLPKARGTIHSDDPTCIDPMSRTYNIEFPTINQYTEIKAHRNYVLSIDCKGEGKNKIHPNPLPLEPYLYSFDGVNYENGTHPTYTFIRNVVIQNSILKYCQSSGCASLLSELRKNFISLVADGLQKDISFELPSLNGNSFRNSNNDNDKEKKFVLVGHPRSWVDDSSYYKDRYIYSSGMLSSYFNLTVEDTLSLPFDISEQEFARVQKERIDKERDDRGKFIDDLKLRVTNKPLFNFLGDWECQSDEITKVKNKLCDTTYLGCMTKEEQTNIVKAIHEGFKDSAQEVSRRKTCLGS